MWTAKKIAKILNTPYEGRDIEVENFHFDTRLLGKNDCFIALDKGHEYLKNSGAVLTIGEHDADLIVKNSHKALWQLAEYARDHSKAKRIAITGSVGKTTTKHFLHQALSQVYKNVVASDKSYNNHIGVPLTLTKLKEDTDIGIFEIGSNHPGEIAPLSKLVQPDIAVVTNISEAHIGNYKDGLEGIRKEKFSIKDGLKKEGIFIGPDVMFQDVDVSFPQEHHKKNLSIVIEILKALGISLHQIDFSKLTVPSSRGKIHKITLNGKRLTIIDDAYNAPYLGMKAALYELSKYQGRRVAVLADMGELGEHEDRLHKEIINYARSLSIDEIIPCGSLFAKVLKVKPVDKANLLEWFKDGDSILFKGSNVSGLGRVVQKILNKI